jgi:Bacterial Ig domain
MSGILRTFAAVPRRRMIAITLLVVGVAFSLAQLRGRADSLETDLPYARGYLITGNYAAGGVDLTEELNPPDLNGLSTGTIHIERCDEDTTFNCVPTDSDIVAAYMYWEAIVPNGDLSSAGGVQFRGEDILLNDVVAVKASWKDLTGSTSSCWSSGAPLKMVHFRADVLRFLPIRLDGQSKPTGKRLVSDEDLTDHGFSLNTARLPTRNGNQVPESAGASLVVVYRHEDEPLRKVVFYDGIDIQESLTDAMTKTIRGFYHSVVPLEGPPVVQKSAQITHLIGSGQPNNNEVVSFNDTPVSTLDPVFGGASSQRAWSTLTYDVSTLMSPATAGTPLTGFGETVTTTVAHTPSSGGYDCLTWGAVVFSTAVQDRDHDGVPDGIEDSAQGLKDPPTADLPLGVPLPKLSAMGAGINTVSSLHPDVFIEVNAMETTDPKDHGSSKGPYPGSGTNPKSVPAHTHMPTPEILAMIGERYRDHGIHAHFDVGNIATYKSRGLKPHTDWDDNYDDNVADDFLIPTLEAKGGEVIDERACNPLKDTCILQGYPGIVSWKVGLQLYRDSPVNDLTGAEFPVNNAGDMVVPGSWAGRRRFDRNRKGLFHYILYAHYRGKRASEKPCLISGVPSDYPPNKTNCTGQNVSDNPDFYRPSSASGVADLPGGNALITLGFWDDYVGRPFVRASTTFHELGHNYNLWHGGEPAQWGSNAVSANTPTLIEPNCKPNYLSSMSYLFQVHGLRTEADEVELNFSGLPKQVNLSETTEEADSELSPTPNPAYRTAWYAPAASQLATSLGVSESSRYCHGEAFNGANPHMARVYTQVSTEIIDWNGDGNDSEGDITHANDGQDINFDHSENATLLGFDDWGSLRLDQISAGRNAVKFQDGDFLDFGSGDFLDFGSGDFLDFGSGDFLDFGSGDFLDFGSGAIQDQSNGDFLDFGSGDFLDFGSGDFLDFGSGDFLDFGSGSERQELDFQHAKGLGRTPPYSVQGCVIGETGCAVAQEFETDYHRPRISWKSPTFGAVTQYEMGRRREAATTPTFEAPIPTSSTAKSPFIDRQELVHLEFYTYRSQARFDDTILSGYSKTVTIEAKNLLPVPNHENGQIDSYQTARNRTLTVSDPELGVRGNDEDPDSPQSAIVIQLASAPPGMPATQGTVVTLNTNGTFTFRPKQGFTGTDYFYYTATNGTWTSSLPNVPINGTQAPPVVQVTVQVFAK